MKIALFGRGLKDDVTHDFKEFFALCDSSHISVCIFHTLLSAFQQNGIPTPERTTSFQKDYDLLDVDIIFSIGGDGTFLRTARLVGKKRIPIVGINTGRLGFLADTKHSELVETLLELIHEEHTIEERSVLKVVEIDGDNTQNYFALNDISVLRRDTSSLIVIHVYVGTNLLNSFWADGLIISTPTGSTAYSMSAGGPIVYPGTNNIILTPIAPHSLTVRPIVIPDSTDLRLSIESRSSHYMLSVDSQSKAVPTSTELQIGRADYPICIAQRKNYNFYETLRNKLMWGVDIRSSNR